MQRIELVFPEPPLFSTAVEIHIGYINRGNHLGNDAVVSLLNEARLRFFAARANGDPDLERGAFFVGDLVVCYYAEAHYGDALRIDVTIGDFSRCGMELFYRLVRVTDGTVIAVARTGMVLVDMTTRKAITITESTKALLTAP